MSNLPEHYTDGGRTSAKLDDLQNAQRWSDEFDKIVERIESEPRTMRLIAQELVEDIEADSLARIIYAVHKVLPVILKMRNNDHITPSEEASLTELFLASKSIDLGIKSAVTEEANAEMRRLARGMEDDE